MFFLFIRMELIIALWFDWQKKNVIYFVDSIATINIFLNVLKMYFAFMIDLYLQIKVSWHTVNQNQNHKYLLGTFFLKPPLNFQIYYCLGVVLAQI